MIIYLRSLAAGLALAGLLACQPRDRAATVNVAMEREAVHEAAALWINAYNARSAGAIASVFTDDAWIIPPDAPAVIGQRAIRDFMARVWTVNQLEYSIGETDLEITSPTAAWRAGRFEARDASGGMVSKGSFVEIWQKVGGNWRIHRSIFNNEAQPAAPSSEAKPATPPA